MDAGRTTIRQAEPQGPAGDVAGRQKKRGRWILTSLVGVMLVNGCSGDDNVPQLAAAHSDEWAYAANVDPNSLVGLDSSQVTGVLGPADFRRADGPAEILQYRSSACVLDLFLYRDDSLDGAYHVKYIEARDRAQAQLKPKACLGTLVRPKRGGQVSG